MSIRKIVCISDTHERHHTVKIPECDLLIHAGDFTGRGSPVAINSFNEWLGKQPARHKVIIAGNHDKLFENNSGLAKSLITNAIYLQDSEIALEGLRIYGTPWQPEFFNWAFNLPRGEELKKKWDMIPDGINVLITHGPPHGFLDKLDEHGSDPGTHVGCEELVKAIERVKPRLCVFGHIHCGYGMDSIGSTTLINASICDEQYRPVNKPITYEIC